MNLFNNCAIVLNFEDFELFGCFEKHHWNIVITIGKTKL